MNQLRFAHVVTRFVDRPLLLLPRHAVAMWNVLCGRFGASPGALPDDDNWQAIDERFAWLADNPHPRASRFAGEVATQDGKRAEPYMRMGDTAILSVVGELVNRGPWVGSHSGMVSYEGIKHQLGRIARDSRVSQVLLDIDSPGGEAIGAFETAKAVRELSAVKPVTASVNGIATSAAYALASGAKRIFTSPTGISGSIGVVMLHMDHSKQIEKAGVVPTLIFAGKHKVDGNPFEPLSNETHDQLQGEVNAFYKSFIETVATGRAGRTSAKAARDTEARTFLGQEAVDAKIVDGLADFESILDAMSRKPARKGSKMMARRASPAADLEVFAESEPEAEDEREQLDIAAITQAANAAGQTVGARSAYDRIRAILADERTQGCERFALQLACEAPDMPAAKVAELAALSGKASASKPIAERAAASLAAAVPSSPEPANAAPNATWGKSVDKASARNTGRH